MIKQLFSRAIKNKEVKNAGWLIGGRIARMLISFFVSILVVRYLGPSNHGIINYVAAYAVFFSAFCTLGINSVIIKDFLDYPEQVGTSIGTSIGLRIVSCLLSSISMVIVVFLVDGNDSTITTIAILYSSSLVFTAFDTINYWFQSKYLSKVVAIVAFSAYVATSLFKIILLILNKSVIWFALESLVESFVIALGLIMFYKKYDGPKWHFSKSVAKRILSKSKHYILSTILIVVYSQTDKLMLKQLLNETEVSYYSLAYSVCQMWVFVLTAIIDSIYPTIVSLYNSDYEAYEKKNRQLYCIVFYCSVAVSMFFLMFSDTIIPLLYGEEYNGAIIPLKIVTWYTSFAYLGVARNAWIVCENKQKYLSVMYICAAVINVIANFFFIPQWGASGAAFATLITQLFTSLIIPLMIKDMRRNAVLMLEGMIFRKIK